MQTVYCKYWLLQNSQDYASLAIFVYMYGQNLDANQFTCKTQVTGTLLGAWPPCVGNNLQYYPEQWVTVYSATGKR